MEETEAENRLVEVNTRAEKRKEKKKMKRKQIRKEVAEMERKIEEARLNDPEELKRLEKEQEEEREAREKALKEFQDREKAWIEAMESKKLALALVQQQQQEEAEEEKAKKDLEQKSKEEDEVEESDSEYGPAQFTIKDNEIFFTKPKVKKVPKKEDAERPTSNPLPPQSEAYSDYMTTPSSQQVLDNVAKEIPNFGTEKDKNHCPFYYKVGACRFGGRCSRAHVGSTPSHTLLMKNMFDVPGLAGDQDEQLEFPDEEIERSYEEFYDDVHSEFLRFGEIVNFKVCRNSSSHLRGNVYVHYKSLESAILAYRSINGRYFAKKQVSCEFVNVTIWKHAICGEYLRSGLKTCSHGMACNFIHCFRNPGGEYKWADRDEPPPNYWRKKMAALFGYSDEPRPGKEIEHHRLSQSRRRSRRSRSRERRECVSSDSDRSRKSHRKDDDRKRARVSSEGRRGYRRNYHNERSDGTSDESLSDIDQDRRRSHAKKTSRNHREMSEYSTDNESKKKGAYSRGDYNGDRQGHRGHSEKRSRSRSQWELRENDGDQWNKNRDKETSSRSHKSPKLPRSPHDHRNSRHHHSGTNTFEVDEDLKSRESNHLDRWEPESPQGVLEEDDGKLDRWRPESPPEVHRRSESRSREHRHSRSGHRRRSEKEAASSEEEDYKKHRCAKH